MSISEGSGGFNAHELLSRMRAGSSSNNNGFGVPSSQASVGSQSHSQSQSGRIQMQFQPPSANIIPGPPVLDDYTHSNSRGGIAAILSQQQQIQQKPPPPAQSVAIQVWNYHV